MSRSLIVLPDDTGKPILNAIQAAQKSIRVKMFVFSDPSLLQAIIDAQHRGVKVRIMLNPARRDGEDDNAESRKVLIAGGVEVERHESEVRPDPRKIHGGRRLGGLCEVAELGD